MALLAVPEIFDPSWIVWSQSTLSQPLIDSLFRGLSSLGSELFYMLLLPIIYWCTDRRLGHRLGFLFLASLWFNGWLKQYLSLPRPFQVEEGVQRLIYAEGAGLPSGHAQGSMTLWGYLGLNGGGWLMAVALLLILLISYSRIHLGVHYPADILAGWLLGGFFIVLFHRGYQQGWGDQWSWKTKTGLIVAVTALLTPAYQSGSAFLILGTGAGFLLGNLYALKHIAYRAQAPLLIQLGKGAVGFSGFVLLYLFNSMFLPHGIASLLGYSLLGGWITVGAPLLFQRLKLTPDRVTETTAPVVSENEVRSGR